MFVVQCKGTAELKNKNRPGNNNGEDNIADIQGLGRSLIHLQFDGRRSAVSEGWACCNEAVGSNESRLCMAYHTKLLVTA